MMVMSKILQMIPINGIRWIIPFHTQIVLIMNTELSPMIILLQYNDIHIALYSRKVVISSHNYMMDIYNVF